jgi:GMP synthase (glutamine-hydrolysing)
MAPSVPSILILRSGHTSSPVIARHGDYDAWFKNAMTETGCRFTLRHVPEEGVGSTAGFDGILVTGTAASVLDEAAWMDGLAGFLAQQRPARPPLLAVCFGEQLAAHGLGGVVASNPKGWEIGSVDVDLTLAGRNDPLFAGLPDTLSVLSTHQDHVVRLPPSAQVLAGNEKTPVQAFAWGPHLRAVQFHPEASVPILAQLVNLRRDKLVADALRQGAGNETAARERVQGILDGLEDSGHGQRILANWVKSYVRGEA